MNYPTREEGGQLRVQVPEGAQLKWRKAEWRECWFCGRNFPFQSRYADKGGNQGRFCSISCQGQWYGKQKRKTRIYLRCVICSTPFWNTPYQHAHKRKVTCGQPECHAAVRSLRSKEVWAKKRLAKENSHD